MVTNGTKHWILLGWNNLSAYIIAVPALLRLDILDLSKERKSSLDSSTLPTKQFRNSFVITETHHKLPELPG